MIYLQQEGRGIGLASEIASYALQDGTGTAILSSSAEEDAVSPSSHLHAAKRSGAKRLTSAQASAALGYASDDLRSYWPVRGILEELGLLAPLSSRAPPPPREEASSGCGWKEGQEEEGGRRALADDLTGDGGPTFAAMMTSKRARLEASSGSESEGEGVTFVVDSCCDHKLRWLRAMGLDVELLASQE